MGKTSARYVSQALRFFDPATTEVVQQFAPIYWYDDFIGKAIDLTNDYTSSVVNSSSFLINVATGGFGRITTGAADTDDHDVCLNVAFQPNMGIGMEARIAMNDVTNTEFCVGFSDEVTEAADNIALMHATTVWTTNFTNGAAFNYSSASTSKVIRAITCKADADGTAITTSTAMVNGVFHIFRVEIDETCLVSFYLDGTCIGTQAAGVTATTLLTPLFALINHETAANTLDIDYIRAWQLKRA